MTEEKHLNRESNKTHRALQESSNSYIHVATSDHTRQAYQSDVAHFEKLGGHLPATPETIEAYLNHCAKIFNPRTLRRRLIAIRQWHKLRELQDPTSHPGVMKTMRGIERIHGKPKRKAAAMLLQDLDQVLAYLDQESTLLTIRDKALLLVGYFGAFRRSELVNFEWEDIQFVREGMVLQLDRSKSDQIGAGRSCAIPFGDDLRCPVRALLDWREASNVWSGKIFRRIRKGGRIQEQAITACGWYLRLKALVKSANVPNATKMSTHSLRRGSTTEAAQRGASIAALKRHGRWRSTRTVLEYIDEGRQFQDSAINTLYNFKD